MPAAAKQAGAAAAEGEKKKRKRKRQPRYPKGWVQGRHGAGGFFPKLGFVLLQMSQIVLLTCRARKFLLPLLSVSIENLPSCLASADLILPTRARRLTRSAGCPSGSARMPRSRARR